MSPALMSKKSYICPVCGYLLTYPPEDFNICPSCGVEFGAETTVYSILDLRQNWLMHGATWSSKVVKPPRDWDPLIQLKNLEARPIPGRSTSVPKEVTWAKTPAYRFSLIA